jgi:hypothetical protein
MLWHSRLPANPGSLWLGSLVHDAVKLYFGVPGRKGSLGKRTGAAERATVAKAGRASA